MKLDLPQSNDENRDSRSRIIFLQFLHCADDICHRIKIPLRESPNLVFDQMMKVVPMHKHVNDKMGVFELKGNQRLTTIGNRGHEEWKLLGALKRSCVDGGFSVTQMGY